MPIPSQNAFLLPFLQSLINGEAITRNQILLQLRKHFQINDEEAQTMSGQQFTLINRIAWCDTYLVKANFVYKTQHPTNSMNDTFRITSLGIRHLRFHPDLITVGYLQSFYNSSIHRGSGSEETSSEAELQLYTQLEALTDEFEIFHGVKWYAKKQGTIGEIDFLIAHHEYGVLVLEVKGGFIQIELGTWYSTSQSGKTNSIRNPCEQADRNRWGLQDWLNEHPRTKNLAFALFPAVALPDSRIDQDISPDCPQAIFIDLRHVNDLRSRIKEIFSYWKQRADATNKTMDGKVAIAALIDLLRPTRQLQPTIADIFERERRKIDELTQQQFIVLRLLHQRKRAAIVGGAGTGKTMLAMEKAQQLLDAGYRVLFLCFNQNLKQWLEQNLRHPNLLVTTFHGITGHAINWAQVSRPRGDFYNQAADLLLNAAQVLHSEKSDKRFDAIIVDEAQDFEDTWWIPLPELLYDPEQGVFYVFFDNNQRIYQQLSNIPMQNEPLSLTDNCRNTQHIHTRMLEYAGADDIMKQCFGPEGRPIRIIAGDDPQLARRNLQRVLHQLINENGIKPQDVIILTATSEKRSQWQQDEALGNFTLSWYLDTEINNAIRVCSIFSYKGLECGVVILTELDKSREDIRDQLIYVGLSRARHEVIVIGELPNPTSKG